MAGLRRRARRRAAQGAAGDSSRSSRCTFSARPASPRTSASSTSRSPSPGDTVVVSAAAGAVGSIAGQIARIAGCRTVGIAGGADKLEDLRDLYRFDDAIDYKGGDVRAAVKAACPDGVDVYFDNVGGEISAAVHPRLNVGARIAICGQVSQYNARAPEPTFHPQR